MTLYICEDRQRVLDAAGHVLITGGPGSGKTTIALLKARKRIESGLLEGQSVLFLSFSRAAVARAVEATKAAGMPPEVLRHLSVQTFHSFFWELLKAYGYLLGAPRQLRLLLPHDEAVFRDGIEEENPQWLELRESLFRERGLVVFDLFASKVSALLAASSRIRAIIASRHPLIIVDEAQDTADDQWQIVQHLSQGPQLVCLADLEQQIYDFRPGVSSERVTQIMGALNPMRVDLEGQNHRSPDSEIVTFGNDILNQTPRGSAYKGVSRFAFQAKQEARDKAIRKSIGIVSKRAHDVLGEPPESIGILTSWGKGVVIISRALTGDGSNRIPHKVNIDEAAAILSSRLVAYLLEPRSLASDELTDLADALELAQAVFRCKGTKTGAATAATLANQSTQARNGKLPRARSVGDTLLDLIRNLRGMRLNGAPKTDWLIVRKLLADSRGPVLVAIAEHAADLPAFQRGTAITTGLLELWQAEGTYEGARRILDSVIAQDQLLSGGGEPKGIHVMTLHKAKGKEFDAVVVFDDANNSPLVLRDDTDPHLRSRRLLRVGVTRARHHVMLLTDVYTPTPLLHGHNL